MNAVKVALCQLNTTIGAFDLNIEKICQFLLKAGEQKAELAVFPELCVSSYPPLDLLDRPGFVRLNSQAFQKLCEKIRCLPFCPPIIILGSIVENTSPEGRAYQNAALVLKNSRIVHVQSKRLLPTYDVFDEGRYFEPGKTTQLWDSPWGRLGLSVCEDAWFEDQSYGRVLYTQDPAGFLRGADFVVNVSASPFEINKRKRRQELVAGFIRRVGAPMIYVNQVGANDEILFDGGSLVLSAAGEVLFEMPHFREGIGIVDLNFSGGGKVLEQAAFSYQGNNGKMTWEKMFFPTTKEDELELVHKGLVTGIRDYFYKTSFKHAVVGLSGGIDSAVVACLATEALGPRGVIGVSMPSQYSSIHSLADAEDLAKNIGIEHHVLSIKFIYTALLMELKPAFLGKSPDITEENLQARLRAMMLMALANKRNGLVLTTGNKSELATGYCTTYGDMAGALAPLGDVYKTRVYELACKINERHHWIPENTIRKPPSAELRPNQTDQDTLPPYEVLDQILAMHIEGLLDATEIQEAGFDKTLVCKALSMVRSSEFKRRQAAPVLKITSKAFGIGRRIPIVKGY